MRLMQQNLSAYGYGTRLQLIDWEILGEIIGETASDEASISYSVNSA